MKCHIYRSNHKSDYYLYLQQKDAFDKLPENLLKPLGKISYCFELDLDKINKLAREDLKTVKHNLKEQGFHLQIPPPAVDLLKKHKEKQKN